MDRETMTFALASSGAALLYGSIALSRKKPSTLSFGLSFAFLAAGAFLLGGQSLTDHFRSTGGTKPWISVFSAYTLVLASHFCLVLGVRLQTARVKLWPRRFWLYALAWIAFGGASAYFAILRRGGVAALSLGIFIMIAEFLRNLHSRKRSTPSVVRGAGFSVALAYSIALAAILFSLALPTGTELGDFFSSFSPSLPIIFLVLWSGVVIFIDAFAIFGELVRRNAALSDLAAKDALTGLPNRYQMDTTLSYEIERSERYGHPLSMAIFDLDDFKRVNDSWGHSAGDAVLKRTAETARSFLRDSDGLFRWGGEEFVIIAPNTPLSGVLSLAEKVRRGLASTEFPAAGSMTASFGVSERLEGEPREAWFERADAALYKAKNAGKNRVIPSKGTELSPIASIKLEWKDEWSSGDRRIDAEHRRMIGMAARLINASLGRSSREELKEGITALLEEAKSHFAHEEKILAEAGYPDTVDHSRLHAELLASADSLMSDSMDSAKSAARFFDFLVDKVVIGHMLGDDARFFPFLKSARLSETEGAPLPEGEGRPR
jgi:diguanylate cyclase (GGDEF)-like protein/hemerythrin-like metal-binding protein